MAKGIKEAVWFCAYAPLELIEAAGFRTRRIFGDIDGLEAADAILHPAFCPFVRACLVEARKGSRSNTAVFVNSCDAMRRLFDAWSYEKLSENVFMIDLPRSNDDESIKLFAASLKSVTDELSRLSGVRVTAEAIREACRKRDEVRERYFTLSEFVFGSERVLISTAAQKVSPEDFLKMDFKNKTRNCGVPIYLTGNILNPNGIIKAIENCNAHIKKIDLCNGDRPFEKTEILLGDSVSECIEGVAKAYLERRGCARMLDTVQRCKSMASDIVESGCKGAVFASLKFCDAYMFEYPVLKGILEKEGIDILRLESDYLDGHEGQISTRIDAFIEMLDSRE